MKCLHKGAHWLLLLLALCLLSLTACGSSRQTLEPMPQEEKEGLESFAKEYMEWLGSLSEEELANRISAAEHQKDAVVYNGLTNYLNSLGRLGPFRSVENANAERTEDGYSIVLDSLYEQRELRLTLGFSEDILAEDFTYLNQAFQASYGMSYQEGFASWTFDEMTFEPNYTMGEQLSDAAGNLVIGMGTVFVVLIFIAWIISLFKYIHIWEENRRDRLKAEDIALDEPVPTRSSFDEAMEEEAISAAAAHTHEVELKVVIAAAIAAYEADMASEAGAPDDFVAGPTLQNGLVVRSIRRR